MVMPGDVIILIGGFGKKGDIGRRRRSIMEGPGDGPSVTSVQKSAEVLPPNFDEGERILFCPQNMNTNIFNSKIKTEYVYRTPEPD